MRTTLTEDRYDEFEKARAIISRKVPGATVEQVLNELVDHYLNSKAPRDKTRLKRAPKPETSSPKARTRHIPNATRDQVMLRDQEQCTFVGKDGHRCATKHNLQIDHIKPFALGGTHDASNLRVLCAAHNRYRGEQTFGRRRSPQRIKKKHKPRTTAGGNSDHPERDRCTDYGGQRTNVALIRELTTPSTRSSAR